MFLINKLLRDASKERLKKHNRENATGESSCSQETKINLKKVSKKRSKKMVNPILTFNDGKFMNYKHKLHHRITLKRGIFPNAIQTNILSRVKGGNQIEKISLEREVIHSPLRDAVAPRHRHKDELIRERKMKNATPKVSNRNLIPVLPSSCVISHSNDSSLKMYNAHHTISRSADSVHPIRLRETVRTKKERRGVEKQSLHFTVYTEEEAQCNLMHKELGKAVQETMIIQNVTYFGNTPDWMEVLHDKLWKLRGLRDEDSENSSESEGGCSTPGMQVDAEEPSNLLAENSRGNDFLECRQKHLQENVNVCGRKQKTSSFEEERLLDGFRKIVNRKAADRTGRNYFLHADQKRNERAHFGDMPFKDGGIYKENGQRDSRNLVHQSEDHSRKFHARKVPSEAFDCRRNSIFNSTLILTDRVEENMTLNPIRFLENVSKDSGTERKRRQSLVKPEMKSYGNVLSYTSPTFGNNLERANEALNEKHAETLRNPYQNELRVLGEHKSHRREFESFPSTYDANLIARQGNLNRPGTECNLSQQCSFDTNRSQDLDFFLLQKVAKKTPEMKYYPYRLY